MWRLVFAKVATLEEIERSWSFDDLLRGNAIADALAEAEAEAYEQARQQNK